MKKKQNGLAAAMSFIIPGLGQIYKGEVLKGLAIFVGFFIGLAIFIIPGLIVWLIGILDALGR